MRKQTYSGRELDNLEWHFSRLADEIITPAYRREWKQVIFNLILMAKSAVSEQDETEK